MRRMTEAWFEFGGVRSDDMGVELLARPRILQPDRKGTLKAVSGRNGGLWLDDGAFGDGSAQVQCMLPDGDMDGVLAWLTGSGWLRFSEVPDRAYRARVVDGFACSQPFAQLSAREFSVEFVCEPFRYLYPAAEEVVLTGASSIVNPGTAESLPRIRIEGSGDFVVQIGTAAMAFMGISTGVIVDSEAMECVDLAEERLLNGDCLTDEFPRLLPGSNAVSWTGNVTRVTVLPRWRYI